MLLFIVLHYLKDHKARVEIPIFFFFSTIKSDSTFRKPNDFVHYWWEEVGEDHSFLW